MGPATLVCQVTEGMKAVPDSVGPYLYPRLEGMIEMLHEVKRFLRDEEGPTAVEYAVMLGMIIVVCMAAVATLGKQASANFSNVALTTAIGNP